MFQITPKLEYLMTYISKKPKINIIILIICDMKEKFTFCKNKRRKARTVSNKKIIFEILN